MASASAIRAGKAYVEISAKDAQLRASLDENQRRLKDFVTRVAAVGAAATVAGAAAAIKAASDMEETMNKFNVVFAESRGEMKAWGDDLAQQVGRSKRQIADFLASTQDLLVPAGIDPKAAEAMSQQVTTLAIDVASFNNKLDADVLRDFHAALTGGGETVKKYGVVLNVAAMNAKLLEAGIDPKAATESQKVWARWQIILDSTTAAQGDAIRSSDGFANQLKRMQGQLEDVAVAAGEVLLPVASELLQVINSGLGPLAEWVSENRALVTTLAKAAAVIGVAVVAIKAITIATTAYAKAAAIAKAFQGPKGWAQIAAGAIAAAAAVAAVDAATGDVTARLSEAEAQLAATAAGFDDLKNKADGSNSGLERTEKHYSNLKRLQGELSQNTSELSDMMDKERTTAEKLGDALGKLDKRARLLDNLSLNFSQNKGDGFSEQDIDQLRMRLIDSMTGFGSEIRKVRDEIGKLNGDLTDADITLREMAEKGLPAQQLEELRAALAELDKAKAADEARKDKEKADEKLQREREREREDRAKELQDRADEIRDALKSPAEHFTDMVDEMRELVKAGVLDRESAREFVNREQKRIARDQRAEPTVAGAAGDLRTTAGASQLIALFNRQGTVEQQLLVTQKGTRENTKRTADALENQRRARI